MKLEFGELMVIWQNWARIDAAGLCRLV